jgi:hypothetical protein
MIVMMMMMFADRNYNKRRLGSNKTAPRGRTKTTSVYYQPPKVLNSCMALHITELTGLPERAVRDSISPLFNTGSGLVVRVRIRVKLIVMVRVRLVGA